MCSFNTNSQCWTFFFNESDIDDVIESIYITIILNTLEKGSVWIIDSAIYHIIHISKYNPIAGSSYVKRIRASKKGLINNHRKITNLKNFLERNQILKT